MFSVKIMSVNILSRDIYISVFIKELGGGVQKYKYSYRLATLHSTLIVFSVKIMCRVKGHFLS
jgi:hypothetical protein